MCHRGLTDNQLCLYFNDFMLMCGLICHDEFNVVTKRVPRIKEQFETKTYINAQLRTPNADSLNIDNILYV